MKRIHFLPLLAMALMGGKTNAQINNIPSTCPNITYTVPFFDNVHINDVEPHRAPGIITTVGGCVNSCSVSHSGNWHAGTWYGGYAETIMPYDDFCNNQGGTHPLIRHTEDQGRAYLHLHNQTGNSAYMNRLVWSMDYLADVAQKSDGGYTVWYYRPDCNSGNVGEIIGPNGIKPFNITDPYETSRALKTLTDGYWYLVKNGNPNAGHYYKAIEFAANNLLTVPIPGNSNYKGFMAWALSAAYKVTGNPKYLIQAVDLADWLQSANNTTHGVWFTGNPHTSTGCTWTFSWIHDTEIWYHLISMRGLIETLYTMPDVGDLSSYRASMQAAIDRATNHLVNVRFDVSTNKFSRYYNGGTIPPACQEYYTYDIEALALLYYYAQTDPHYGLASVVNLRNLLNCLMAGSSNSEREYLKNLAFYSDYTEASTSNPSLSLYKTGDVDDEVLQQFTTITPYKVYRSEDGLSLGTGSIYSGSTYVKEWITGDFDGNGIDELLYQFNGAPIIHRMTNPANLSTSDPAAYPGPSNIEKWIVGDFDGDGKDELVYKFSGSNDIFKTDDNTIPVFMTGANLVYTSTTSTIENWIVGDFNGDGNDELLFKLNTGPAIRSSDLATSLASAPTVFSGPQLLDKWIVGEFMHTALNESDELLFKFQGSNEIYQCSNANFSLSNPICSNCTANNLTLERWVTGDFDGDMNDELIYKFTGSRAIYNSKNAVSLNPGATDVTTIYPSTGSYNIEHWLVGDFDGNRNDEILNKFAGLNKIYRSDNGLSLGSTLLVYDWTQPLRNWISGNFDGMINTNKQLDAVAERPEAAFDLEVYPVPASDQLQLRFSTEQGGSVQADLYNLQGMLVANLRNEEMKAGTIEFNWSRGNRIPDGVYMLRVTMNDRSIVKRVVFQN